MQMAIDPQKVSSKSNIWTARFQPWGNAFPRTLKETQANVGTAPNNAPTDPVLMMVCLNCGAFHIGAHPRRAGALGARG